MNKALLSDAAGATGGEDHNAMAHCDTNRLIRLPEVMERVGLRRTAIYQRMREGQFPKSRSLGARCTVWVEAEINNWIRNVIQEQ